MKLYKWKMLRRGTLEMQSCGEEVTYSKLHLRDKLASEHPRIPKKNIIVWDPEKQKEPFL